MTPAQYGSQVTNGLTLGPTKDADCDLSWIQATRFVAERAFRERLLALYGNVQLRSGCWVSSLEPWRRRRPRCRDRSVRMLGLGLGLRLGLGSGLG